MKINFALNFVCLYFLALVIGCDSGPDVAGLVGATNATNIQKVANSLALYQGRIGRPAKDEAELCEFIANNPSIEKNLGLMQIDRTAFKDYLISERDGEPMFLLYGARIPPRSAIPLVLEATGVDGSKQVCWSDAKITEVADAKEYENLKRGKIKKSESDAQAAALEEAAKGEGN